jgi:Uma2 family endonuclease
MRLTRAQYHRLGEVGLFEGRRVQLIEGEVIVMAPMGADHAHPLMELNELLLRALPKGFKLRPQLPLVLGDESEPQPDFAIVREGDWDSAENPSAALLAIEVADSSLAFDLGRKAALYARHDIAEYWVLDVKQRVLVVHRSPGTTRYRSVKTLKDLSAVSSSAVPGLTVDLRHVFARRR